MRATNIPFLAALLLAPACRSDEARPKPAKAEKAAASIPAIPLLPPKTEKTVQPTPAAAPVTRADRLEALRKEHRDAMDAYYKLFRDAKTDEESQKVAETNKAPDPQTWAPRFWEIVNEDPKDDVAFGALQWLVRESQSQPDRERAIATIMKEQIASAKLGDLCDSLPSDPSTAPALLERILAESPHHEVKGHALYALAKSKLASVDLAKRLQKQGTDPEELKGLKEWIGAERSAELEKLDAAKAQTEAETMLERVANEYADVKFRKATLADSAKGELHEMRDLVVGKPAPEIEGEDLAGAAIKLSDYRGKVVMLDFWGNW